MNVFIIKFEYKINKMSEIKQRIEDVMDDFKGRIKNPLILSFILVWLYYHWSLVYKFFTINESINVDDRILMFKKYIWFNGWSGMILKPLILSFVSLAFFYFIGALGQFIKVMVGKRFTAWITLKFDVGNYVTKVENESSKRKLKNLQIEFERINNDYHSLQDRLKIAEQERDVSVNELIASNNVSQELKNNITSNKEYKSRLEITLIYLLAKVHSINISLGTNLIRDSFGVIDGNWNIGDSKHYLKEFNSFSTFIFKDGFAYNQKMEQLFKIDDFVYDRVNRIIRFTSLNDKVTERYVLIKVSDDEFIGFRGESDIVRFERAYVNLQN